MNTTVNVNLAGQHFNFDQAAKVKLEVYFEEIKFKLGAHFVCKSLLKRLTLLKPWGRSKSKSEKV